MSIVSISLETVDHIEAGWITSGDAFYINAYEGGAAIGPGVQQVSLILTEEQLAELQDRMRRPKPTSLEAQGAP